VTEDSEFLSVKEPVGGSDGELSASISVKTGAKLTDYPPSVSTSLPVYSIWQKS